MSEESGEKNFVRGMIVLGLFIIAVGVLPIWMVYRGLGELYAPKWVVVSAGLMFISAGIAVGSMDTLFNPLREKVWFASIQLLAVISIPLILLLVLNWVSFGPGEREFSVSISIPFVSAYFENANQLLGRIFFAIPALIGDLLLGGVIYKMIADWINDQGSKWRW